MNQFDSVIKHDELPSHLQSIGAGLDFTDPNSPLAPYYIRTSDVAAAALLAAMFFVISIVPLNHTDIWGHLKYGRSIVHFHRLPEKDLLSPFADPDANSIHVYWLCQTGIGIAYNTGAWLADGNTTHRLEAGIQMLHAVHASLVVGRYLFLLLALRRLGCSPAMACVGLFIFILLSFVHSAVMRPQVFGEFFLACLLYALSRKELSRWATIILPIVLTIWANAHGSFLLGLAVVAGCLLGDIIQFAIRQRALQPRVLVRQTQIRRLGITLLASILAITIFNPHGPFIYSITLAMSQHPNVIVMDEWQPLSFAHPDAWTFIYLVTLLLLIGIPIFSRDWYSPAQIILMIGIGVQPLLHQRMMVWWVMLAPWLALPMLSTALERLPLYWKPGPVGLSFRKTIFAGLIIAVVALWSSPGQWLISGKATPLSQSVSQGTPWQLAQELNSPSERPSGWQETLAKGLVSFPGQQYAGTIFATETLGDYFAWFLPHDKMPVYIDSHVHLFSVEQWQRTAIVKAARPQWKEMLDAAGVNLVVVEAELYPSLRDAIKEDADWLVVQDESGSSAKRTSRDRLFAALRKKPK